MLANLLQALGLVIVVATLFVLSPYVGGIAAGSALFGVGFLLERDS